MDETTYRAAELRASNVKRLRAVALTIPEDGVTLAGRNGAGKSSVLDSIAAALGGAAAQPERPIHDGADQAEIRLTLDAQDGGEPQRIVITRAYRRDDEDGSRFTTSLRVRYDDENVKRPQSALDALRGATVDPRAWSDPPGVTKPEARDRARLRMLVGALKDGFDLEAHAREREKLADRRLLAGREKRAKEAVRDELGPAPALPEAPSATVREDAERRLRQAEASVSEWRVREQERQRRLEVAGDEARAAKSDIDRLAHELSTAKGRVAELRRQLEIEERRLDDVKHSGRQAEARCGRARAELDRLAAIVEQERQVDPQPDPAQETERAEADLAAYHASVDALNAARTEAGRRDLAELEATEAARRWSGLVEQIAAMDERLALAVAALPMPDDVEITPELRVMVGGQPIDQASAAERLRAAVGVAAGLCGRLRLLWVHDGALLDGDSRAALAAEAQRVGVQLIVETVEPSEGAVVIEDGRVAQD